MARTDTTTSPFVSIIIPVRNEAAFIDGLVRGVLAQDYPPDRFEVIVADGMSTDGTRETLAKLQAIDTRLIVLDNPCRIVPTGLNLAVAHARGEFVIRIDGHATIAPDFIRQNVTLLAEHVDAWIVGGPIRHKGTTALGRAIARAMSHPLGVGNAVHRYPEYEGYVESAQFPAIRRWVFDRVGLFDEQLVRNQDDELHYRVRKAGGKIYISPKVRYSYFVRGRLGRLFKQYFQYGFWRIPVIEKHGRPTTVRQMAPTLFHAACVLLTIVALWLRLPVVAIVLPAAYAAALVAAAGLSIPRLGVRVSALLPIAIATMHAGYAWGLAYGLWAKAFNGRAWDTKGRMATLSR
jgi:glycosyltransferase involved in cell wall biosynthesis